jgi:N utilization substance protein A
VDFKAFTQAIQQLADEKGIAKEKIFETIEMALVAAYKRDWGKRGQIIRAALNPSTGQVAMKQIKIAVDETMIKSEEEIRAEEEERMRREKEAAEGKTPRLEEEFVPDQRREAGEEEQEKKVRFNPDRHIMMEEARAVNPEVQPGDELEFPLEYDNSYEYGRIAAQTAKQVILQRIREAERETVFEEYKNREGEVISGLIQRIEGRNVFLDIGRATGLLPLEEQIPYERYRVGERLKTVILLVEKSMRGPGVFLSRSHPNLLKGLFEIEVPEIASGIVEIKGVAREPGSRSKVAAVSHEPGVDPVGSLVGQKGVRVSTVIGELGGEKIDVIEWSENSEEFVGNALSPAKVLDVEIDERRHEARVIVPEEQLSLAIGKGGQNVRLAAKLTGWKIDVRSEKAAGGAASEPPGSEEPSESPDGSSESEESESDSSEKGSGNSASLDQSEGGEVSERQGPEEKGEEK